MVTKRHSYSLTHDNGFTLLEMLIALSLVALIMVILLGALRLSIRAWEKGEVLVTANHSRRITLDRIRRQLSAATFQETDQADATRALFVGNNRSVTFISALAMDPNLKYGWVQVRYVVDRGINGINRLRIFERNLAWIDNPSARAVETQDNFIEWVNGFENLFFEYLKPDSHEATLDWKSIWRSDGTHKLPSAVRVTYTEPGMDPIRVIARIARKT